MGPIALFDKSFLQSLSVDESVWFDHFFYPTVCPMFYVETLADLSKSTVRDGRTPDDEVRIIANKTPEMSGTPCAHHAELCISDLMGVRIPMSTRQVPRSGGREVRGQDGRLGLVYDHSPEAEAFKRWQAGDFQAIERQFADGWRKMLTSLDLPKVADRMRTLGIKPGECRTVEQAFNIANALVRSRSNPFEQIALLFAFVEVPRELHTQIVQRWAADQYRPLAQYAPYAAHVLTVELFFQIALGANLISSERASNRVDIAYLFYLPFGMIFVSGDKLHRTCVPPFLQADQAFVWGPELKAELARIDKHFATLSSEELEKGIMKFARDPPGETGDLIVRLFDSHMPAWRKKAPPVETSPEESKRIIEKMNSLEEAPGGMNGNLPTPGADYSQMTIKRRVTMRKGKWWQLPKDLKVE